MTDAYRDFLAAKVKLATGDGLPCEADEVNPLLKPHQRDAVVWNVRGGRRADFLAFGLGKTFIQLETERLMLAKLGSGRGLITCPLGVRQEFVSDAYVLATGDSDKITDSQRAALRAWQREDPRRVMPAPTFIRSAEDATTDGLYLTNYESVRDGKLDPRAFEIISLDEAAIMRGFGGTKTFREFMRMYEGSARYRFVATATPSPNEYIELLAYAAFLDIMDVGQAKTRFFKRDSTKADALTLRPHQEREFWLWVASWALFVQKPSDLGYDDTGYALPPLDVRWHELPSAAAVGADAERDGQARMFRNTALGVVEASREKRESLDARIATAAALVDESPDDHFLLWHDLEAERYAISAAIPEAVAVWGTQDLDERERRIIDFSEGRYRILATKPVIAGSGCNFQRHCHRAIFVGIGWKFAEFIQAIHRILRFLQTHAVRIDIIYTDAERQVRHELERRWRQHETLVAQMGDLIREFGLSEAAMAGSLARTLGVERQEARGEGWRVVNNDAVLETQTMAMTDPERVGLIVTSIPFATQYEYTPSFNDFGHSESNEDFWRQMDFLTPELYRVLMPGRVAAIHVKDRIAPGGLTNWGFQTVQPFSAEAIFHYIKHGFAYLGPIVVTTDVVRENNQTYRLGWTEQCKDGSRMGRGMSEHILLFRKPPTDRSDGYADVPVLKEKADYSLARWQVDANGHWRSSGNRLLSADELALLPHEAIYKRWREFSRSTIYDYEQHVALVEGLGQRLPVTFALMPAHSVDPAVWSDVARMRTLNMQQERKGREMHLCPLQFDIVDRLIVGYSMAGETVYDPFGGIMTVPYCAIRLGRRAVACELNPVYWRDGVGYCYAAEREIAVPTLFDVLNPHQEDPA